MNKLLYLIMIAGAMVLAGSLPVSARVVDLQDFESGTVGNTLEFDGWISKADTNDIVSTFFTVNSTAIDPNVHTGKVGDCNGFGGQIWKPFNVLNDLTDNETDVYVKYLYIVQTQPFSIGPLVGEGAYANVGPQFGQAPAVPASGIPVTWQISKAKGGATVRGDNASLNTSYEVLLQIKFNKTTPSASTGTLYHRLVGQTVWTVDSILQNITLDIDNTCKPSTWGAWYVGVTNNGAFDNLTIGTGDIHNCVPSSADINSDCKVNLIDFAIMAKSWLTQ